MAEFVAEAEKALELRIPFVVVCEWRKQDRKVRRERRKEEKEEEEKCSKKRRRTGKYKSIKESEREINSFLFKNMTERPSSLSSECTADPKTHGAK